MRTLACLIIFLIIIPTIALGQDIPDYTDLYVNDFAGVLSAGQTDELRSLFAEVERNSTAEVTVLTVDSVSPYDMSQYAQEVFEKWKIGKADKDNGLLILYAKDTQKIWVATGYGLEGILPDSKVGSILDDTFVPARAAGNSPDGIVLAAHAYADVINANADEVRSGQAGSGMSLLIILEMLLFMAGPFVIAVLLIFVSYSMEHPKCPKCGGRSDAIKTQLLREKTSGSIFPRYYTLITYKCRKCGETFQKEKKGVYRIYQGVAVAGGGYGGGGFGGGGFGGGFGGGGFGGGGAGR